MEVLKNILLVLKMVLITVKNFFTKEDKAKRSSLSNFDIAEIALSLAPCAVFGCLLFGWRALIVLLVSSAVAIVADFLWDILFKKGYSGINYSQALTAAIIGLSISSITNIALVASISLLGVVLNKVFFKNRPSFIVTPTLISRIVVGLIFLKAFSLYAAPFVGTRIEFLPIQDLFITRSFVLSAKYLFFGLHSGNIGETSILMLLIGGIYLILRKVINPIISVGFIVTVGVLSLIFHQSLSISLMGSGLFFTAIYLTMDYGFQTTPLYKKVLYGIFCGILTFVIRILFKTEGAIYAVLIANIVFTHINGRSIEWVVRLIKSIDFKGIIAKVLNNLNSLRKIICKNKDKGEEI